jgi:hypothetical protein
MTTVVLVLIALAVGLVIGRGRRPEPVVQTSREYLPAPVVPPPPVLRVVPPVERVVRVAIVLMDRDEREAVDCLWVEPRHRPRWVSVEDRRYLPASGSVQAGYFLYRESVH